MDRLWITVDGDVTPYDPQPIEVPIAWGRLTDNQAAVIRKFLLDEALDRNERKTLRTALWRLTQPEAWWKGRGRTKGTK
jgi:hypothetical protein